MKKYLLFIISILLLCALASCHDGRNTPTAESTALTLEMTAVDESSSEKTEPPLAETSAASTEADTTAAEPDTYAEVTVPAPESTEQAQPETAEPSPSLTDTLYIGDSRTVGLCQYSGITADFFAENGMSVYNVRKKTVTVPSVGKFDLEGLLGIKEYGKIYLMLGINELGYDPEKNADMYGSLIEYLKLSEPNACIFIQANLHVTAERSAYDKYINNPAIDRFNQTISLLADGSRIFYLDANPLFNDENGNLAAVYAFDSAHLYPKYYEGWAKWINDQSEKSIRGV